MGKEFGKLTNGQRVVRVTVSLLMLPLFIAVAFGAHWVRQAKKASNALEPYRQAFFDQSREDWQRVRRWWADAL